MANELQDGSEVTFFQDEYLAEDELLITRETQNSMQIWKHFGFQRDDKGNLCSKD